MEWILTMEIRVYRQRNAALASDRILDYFNHCAQKGEPYDIYPDYYAGGYIGDDNIYHACFADASDRHVEECLKILSEFGDYVKIEYRKYSYTELQEYADKVADGLKALGCVRYNWGVDVSEGTVNIGVDEDSIALAMESLALVADNPDIKVIIEVGYPLILE